MVFHCPKCKREGEVGRILLNVFKHVSVLLSLQLLVDCRGQEGRQLIHLIITYLDQRPGRIYTEIIKLSLAFNAFP